MPLLKLIEDAIRTSAHGKQVRHLHVVIENGLVILMGQASTFYSKSMAQEVAKKCLSAGMRLENRIDVSQA
jgi:osmotically-inducible protein OsmY